MTAPADSDIALVTTPVSVLARWVEGLRATDADLDEVASALVTLARADDLDAAGVVAAALTRAAYERRAALHDREVADLDAVIAHDQLREAFRARALKGTNQ